MKREFLYKYQPIQYELNNIQSDLRKLISEKLNICISLNTEPLTTLLLILMLYVPIISEEEFFYFFRIQTISSVHRAFDILRDSGLIHSVYLHSNNKSVPRNSSTTDSRTLKAFIITRKGFSKVCHYLGLERKSYNEFTSCKYYMHAYSLGWNVLAILTNPYIPKVIAYDTEKRLELYGRKDLFCDGAVKLPGATLYLEQDVGTERTSELRDKLIRYGVKSYDLQSSDYIVLSVRKRYVNISPIGHEKGNERYCKRILGNVLDYMDYYRCVLNPPSLSSLIDLLGNSPLLDSASAESDFKDFKALKRDLSVNSLEFLDTYESIKNHLDSYKKYNSIIYNDDINHIQWDFCVKKRNSLIQELINDFRFDSKSVIITEDIRSYIIAGKHLYIIPTTMMSYYLPFILFDKSIIKRIVENTIASFQIFKGFCVENYLKSDILNANGPYHRIGSPLNYNLRLVNVYDAYNCIISIENLSIDISAPLRVFSSIKWFSHERRGDSKDIIIIAMVDSIEDADYFNQLLRLYEIPYDSCFQVLFMQVGTPYFYNKQKNMELITSYRQDTTDQIFFRYKTNNPQSRYYMAYQ